MHVRQREVVRELVAAFEADPEPARPRPAARLGRRRRRRRARCACSSTRWPRSPTSGRSPCTAGGAAPATTRLAHARITDERRGGQLAGRITAEDIATVKERTSIEDVVREHVTLRPAGVGSLKGLCPFHDEKSPSLHRAPDRRRLPLLRLRRGRRRHLVRAEGRPPHLHRGRRAARRRSSASSCATRTAAAPARAACRSAAVAADRGAPRGRRSSTPRSCSTPAGPARVGRDFLRERGFDGAAAERFGIGFAPQGGEALEPAPARARASPTTRWSPAGCPARGSAASTTGSAGASSGRSATSPATPSASARAGSSTTTGSRRSTSTPPRPRSTRSRRCSTASTSPRRRSRTERRRPSSSRATPTSWPATWPASRRAVATCGTAFGADHIKILRRLMRDETDGPQAKRHLHLRRRRRRPEGRDAGLRRGPALGLAVVRRRRAVGHGPVRAAPGQGRRRRARARRRRRADVRVRGAHDDHAASTSTTAEGRVQADAGRRPDHRLDPRPSRCGPSTPARCPGWLGSTSSRSPPRSTQAGRVRHDDAGDTSAPARPAPTTARAGAGRGRGAMPVPDLRDPVVLAERQLLQVLLQFPRPFKPTGHRPADARRVLGAGAPRRLRRHPHRRTTPRDKGNDRGLGGSPSPRPPRSPVRRPGQRARRGTLPTRMDASTGLPPRATSTSSSSGCAPSPARRQIADAMSEMRRARPRRPTPPTERTRELGTSCRRSSASSPASRRRMV